MTTKRNTLDYSNHRHAIASTEDQIALALRIQRGDRKAADIICRMHYPFVFRAASQRHSHDVHFEDLVQEGLTGLLEGFRRFVPNSGSSPLTYSAFRIKAYMSRHLRETCRTVRLPANATEYGKAATKKIANAYGIDPKDKEGIAGAVFRAVMDKLITRPQGDMVEAIVSGHNKSINDYDGAEHGCMTPEAFRDHQDHGHMRDEEIGGIINAAMANLNPMEREVIAHYYGMGSDATKTFREIGAVIGLSHERVRQIKEKALTKLRAAMEGVDV
jgi:RNA polymerase primary sigma factor